MFTQGGRYIHCAVLMLPLPPSSGKTFPGRRYEVIPSPCLVFLKLKGCGARGNSFPISTHTFALGTFPWTFCRGSSGRMGGTGPCQLLIAFPGGIPAAWGCQEGQRFQQSRWEGMWSWEASWHLLQSSRNDSVPSTAFITRGAERHWGALMGCKKLFPPLLTWLEPSGERR